MKFTAVIGVPLWLLSLPVSNAAVFNRNILSQRDECTTDEMLRVFEEFSEFAIPLCSILGDFPDANVAPKFVSACSCLTAATATSAIASTSSVAVAPSIAATSSGFFPYPSANSTVPASTGFVITSSPVALAESTSTSEKSSKSSTSKTTKVTSKMSTVASSSNATSVAATSTAPASVSTILVTTSAVSVAAPSVTTGSNPTVSVAASCTVTAFSALAAATSACTAIMIKDMTVPAATTLDLTGVNDGTVIVFSGTTTFEFAAENYDLIKASGTDIEITAESGAIIDGNGGAWWDGQGSNGGVTKPDHFFVVDKLLGSSSIHGLYIQNWPTHCFEIENSVGLSVYDITLNNTAGNSPNAASGSDPAAHNSDGFDVSSSNNTILYDISVYNQDDCVAVTSGYNVTISGFYCSGGHGLSIGSVGGKSDNSVVDITFQDSTVVNSQNGARIKTNSGTTGNIQNIVYKNIVLSEISDYGIDIQQDYLNGGPTGTPTNGVTITGVTMSNITGTATSDAQNYYILCGSGSCSDFTFTDVDITGGKDDSCNFMPTGFTCA